MSFFHMWIPHLAKNQEGLIKDIDKDCKNKMEISLA